ncbi:MAG: SbcC/MukB-like Walker B domain-containing protein [Desulfitobacteriaceae bacterium]
MKPIRLEITGLNSFRDTQVIEFDRLSETGVFGIFGPTGSGKSTVLDAITLALYGTVERASNNTQGILNHSVQQLSVKFAFSLNESERRKIYRAERSYKRSGERTVTASVCRLVEAVEGDESVLAAKDKEMTKRVEEVLGLNSLDFTRAVVLPQGKFAEFLSIKPKERREMLERLFALEAYGKELNAKIGDRLRNTEFDLNGVEQRQQGLGDASPERLVRAEVESDQAIVLAAATEQQLGVLRSGYDAAKEVWTIQEELRQIKGREQELETRREILESIKERLDLALRAENIRPMLVTLSRAEENLLKAQAKMAVSQETRNIARLTQETAASKWKSASVMRLEVEPQILRRIERLEQAKSWEKEILERSNVLQGMRAEYTRVAKTKETVGQRLNLLKDQMEKARISLLTSKQRLLDITVLPSQRVKVNTAAQALEGYQMLFKQVEGLAKDYQENQVEVQTLGIQFTNKQGLVQKSQEEVGNLKSYYQNIQQSPPGNEEDLSEEAQKLERFRALLSNIERVEKGCLTEKGRLNKYLLEASQVQEELSSLERDYAQALKQRDEFAATVEARALSLKELETQNLAGLLAEGLKDGEFCPVCGSLHHPLPGHAPETERIVQIQAILEEAKQQLNKSEQEVGNLYTKLAVATARFTNKLEQQGSQKLLVGDREKDVAEYRDLLSPAEKDIPIPQLYAKLRELELSIALEREAFIRWKKAGEEAREKLEEAQAAFSSIHEESAKAQADSAATVRAGQEIGNRLSQIRLELSQKQAELDKVRGDIDIQNILLLQKQYEEWDLEADRINREQMRIEENLRDLEGQEHGLQEERAAQELVLKDLEATGREAGQNLETAQAKLEELVHGQSVAQVLQAEEGTLAEVRQVEEESKRVYEEVQKSLNQAEQDYAVLTKELEINQHRVEEAQEILTRGLIGAQFKTIALAKDALCVEDERQKMQEEIRQFQQNEALLRAQRSEALEKLNERKISPEDWLAWPIRLKEAEKNNNEAMERRGATQDALLRLREKHFEWKELEGQRKSLSHRLGLIKTLQSVFKGNSFVEFVAEEQLINVAMDASERLAQLTNYRYALEVDSEGGFVIRDDANGGFRRPVNSLSGGETFLTSLALALALSSQIQLRGEAPLEFFFLDEGFGTLDSSLLEVVMGTLEKLHLQNLTIGIISHVPELRNRLARRIIVTPAEPGGAGSKIKLEMA